MNLSPQLYLDEMAIILMCMEDVVLKDVASAQRALQHKLCKLLKREVPEHYAALVNANKFTDRSK